MGVERTKVKEIKELGWAQGLKGVKEGTRAWITRRRSILSWTIRVRASLVSAPEICIQRSADGSRKDQGEGDKGTGIGARPEAGKRGYKGLDYAKEELIEVDY